MALTLNSLRQSDAYMHRKSNNHWLYIKTMAWRQPGDKSLSDQMMEYYSLDPQEQTSVKFYSKS